METKGQAPRAVLEKCGLERVAEPYLYALGLALFTVIGSLQSASFPQYHQFNTCRSSC